MKIYTRTGDDGETGLFAGARVPKDSPRIEAFGAVDELNSVLGLARCEALPEPLGDMLLGIQNELFVLASELACLDPAKARMGTIGDAEVKALEQHIDAEENKLRPLKNFILPGGTRGAALLHLARTVCRRAERRVLALVHSGQGPVGPGILVYLNRLSDLLFVLARRANAAAGCPDERWPPLTGTSP